MKNYIPKHRSDIKPVKYLKSLSFETVRADVPKLLECIQDMHWDIAHGIAEYLIPHVNEIKEELLDILQDNDEIWKYNIIRSLIWKFPKTPDQELISIIKRIASQPTKSEIEDGVDEVAREIVLKKNW